MIRAVFFDAAGTLIYLPKGVGWHYRQVASAHGLDLEEGKLNVAFRNAFATAPHRDATQGPRPGDDKPWWCELVRTVLAECGRAPDGAAFESFFSDLYAHFAGPGVWEVYPDVIPVLDNLGAAYRLGIVSNFDRRLYSVLEHAGIGRRFDVVTLSSEVGADKPDPRIFQSALDRLGLRPDEALHAGDHPVQDWLGAEAAGLHVFRLRRPENSLADVPSALAAISPSAR